MIAHAPRCTFSENNQISADFRNANSFAMQFFHVFVFVSTKGAVTCNAYRDWVDVSRVRTRTLTFGSKQGNE